MTVALFASAFYPSLGGVEELVRQLAHAYQRAGVPTIVLTERWPRSLPSFEVFEGIPVYRFAFRVPEGCWKRKFSYHLRHRQTFRRILRVLRRHDVDCLHIHCVSSNGFYALRAARALLLPLVVTAHGELTMDASQVYARSEFLRNILRSLLKEADHVTACSCNTLRDIEAFFGGSLGERSSVIYPGVQLSDFAMGKPYVHRRSYVLGIGRLVRQKGFDILIRAFAAANLPCYDLLIAGDGPERSALTRLAADLGMQERIRFLGRAGRDQVVSLFHGAAFFVLPSRQEPFGIVNMEAMAAGKAVIATRVGGVPEIVRNGENGLLVPGEDVSGLSAAIVQLASDTALRDSLGEAAKQYASRFDWNEIASAYLSVYDTARGRTLGLLMGGEVGADS